MEGMGPASDILRIVGRRALKHFIAQGTRPSSFIISLRPKLTSLLTAGYKTPESIAAELNALGIRTACGEPWTVPLAAHLRRLLIMTEPRHSPGRLHQPEAPPEPRVAESAQGISP